MNEEVNARDIYTYREREEEKKILNDKKILGWTSRIKRILPDNQGKKESGKNRGKNIDLWYRKERNYVFLSS